MDDPQSLQGPVETIDGKLVLRIPLEAGGDEFIECSRGISEVRDGYLVVEIKEWLAGLLRIEGATLFRSITQMANSTLLLSIHARYSEDADEFMTERIA